MREVTGSSPVVPTKKTRKHEMLAGLFGGAIVD